MFDRRLTFVYFIMRFHSFLIALRPSHPDAGKFRERRGFRPLRFSAPENETESPVIYGQFWGDFRLAFISSFLFICYSLFTFGVQCDRKLDDRNSPQFLGGSHEVGEERFVISHPASRSRRHPVNVRA